MRNPWKLRTPPDECVTWTPLDRERWIAEETDRLMLWWWSFPGLVLALICGGFAVAGIMGGLR